MSTKEELKELLRKINSTDDVKKIKPEIKEKLRDINPADLSRAEQEMAEEEEIGVEQIRKLCEPHLEIIEEKELKEEGGESEDSQDKQHPREILESEHEVLLEKLEELGEIIDKFDGVESYEELGDDLERLKDIADYLLGAENHHNREEEALFPRVEQKGLTGPTEVMREEHEDYLEKKKRFGELVEDSGELKFEEFASKVERIGRYLVEGMNDHIYKENNILYPAAGDVLEDGDWEEIKGKFDQMGYTFFTPGLEEDEDEDEAAETPAGYEIGEELDLRETPPPDRHPIFFEKFDNLNPGQKLVLINDHEPSPLFYEMKEVRTEVFDLESYQVFERGDEKFEAHFPKKREKDSSQSGDGGQTADEDEVWKKLEKVEDPEFGTSVVEMDLIDEVSIDGVKVSVDFHLTAPVCPPPFVLNMAKQIKKYVSELENISRVEVTVKEHNQAEELNQKLENMEE